MNRTIQYILLWAVCQWVGVPATKAQKIPPGPSWLGNAVFYQVYPQTFKDTNGDGIGDLQGVIDKLDYIKSLGANAIWLNPFFLSPFCDAGYDVADFYTIDPRYGDNATAKRLFEEAHARGIKVVLDFVIGHTSVEHPWFKASINKDPKYANWFIWTSSTWKKPKKDTGKFIRGYSSRDGSYMTNFFWCQPKLNYGYPKAEIKYDWQLPLDHPDVMALKDEMRNILRHWLAQGVDGFRVDMAYSAGVDFWQGVRRMFDQEYPEALLISEWGDPTQAVEAGFHADFMHWFEGYGDLFHKPWFTGNPDTHSFFESAGKGDLMPFLDAFVKHYERLKHRGYISVPVGNHDMVRIKNFGRDDHDLELVFAFQMTFPSIPFVYYGDEIGMRQLPLADAPAVEGSYGGRSGNRTPMQWAGGPNYGFSNAAPEALYLPQDDQPDAPTVASQMDNPNSLWHTVNQLISLRKTEKALQAHAAYESLYAKPGKYPFIYSREANSERILVVLNPSAQPVKVPIGIAARKGYKLVAGQGIKLKQMKGYTQVDCGARGYGIFRY